jgi:hypothetical protein
VLLLARKNPDLQHIMKEFVDQTKMDREEAAKAKGGSGSAKRRA